MDSDPEPLHPCTKTTLHKLYHHIVTTTTPAPPPDTRFPRSFRFQQINQSFTNLQTNLFSILPTSNSFLEELLQPETPLSPTAPPNDRNRPLTTPDPPVPTIKPLVWFLFCSKTNLLLLLLVSGSPKETDPLPAQVDLLFFGAQVQRTTTTANRPLSRRHRKQNQHVPF
jgi:hypothetical protein